jgi:hypothetical protein
MICSYINLFFTTNLLSCEIGGLQCQQLLKSEGKSTCFAHRNKVYIALEIVKKFLRSRTNFRSTTRDLPRFICSNRRLMV